MRRKGAATFSGEFEGASVDLFGVAWADGMTVLLSGKRSGVDGKERWLVSGMVRDCWYRGESSLSWECFAGVDT